MLRDKEGNKLFRRVEVTVYFPEGLFPPRKIAQKAGPHSGFNDSNIDEMLMKLSDQLDTLYPYWEFNPIELSPVGRTARFVFEFAGYKHGVSVPVDISSSQSATKSAYDGAALADFATS